MRWTGRRATCRSTFPASTWRGRRRRCSATTAAWTCSRWWPTTPSACCCPRALPGAGRRVGFFPGSTIGNFAPQEALHFLQVAAQVLRGGALLLGADLVKDPAVLHAAYNDAQGVTAAFNLNLLARANRELGTRFALDQFAHSAFYNAPQQRIEMHLVSRRAPAASRWAAARSSWTKAKRCTPRIRTSSPSTGLRALALRAGFRPGPVWTDEERLVQRALAARAATRSGSQQRERMKAIWNGAVIAQSDDTVVMDGNHYFPAEFAQARVRHLQQPPHQQPLEGRGELLLAAGQRRNAHRRRLVLPRPEAGSRDAQGSRGLRERREDRGLNRGRFGPRAAAGLRGAKLAP